MTIGQVIICQNLVLSALVWLQYTIYAHGYLALVIYIYQYLALLTYIYHI